MFALLSSGFTMALDTAQYIPEDLLRTAEQQVLQQFHLNTDKLFHIQQFHIDTEQIEQNLRLMPGLLAPLPPFAMLPQGYPTSNHSLRTSAILWNTSGPGQGVDTYINRLGKRRRFR